MSASSPNVAHYLLLIGLVGITYFVAARLGLTLAFSTQQLSAVWPPTGIALTALLLVGQRFWPGVFLAALTVNVLAHEPIWAACAIALGNTATALIGAAALRAVSFDGALERTRDVAGLLAVAFGSTLVSATLGTLTLAMGAIVPWSESASVWWLWWAGDSLGVLIVAPVLLTWVDCPRMHWKGAHLAELAVYLAATVLFGLTVFVLPSGSSPSFYPRAYVAFPLIAWAGLRLRPREAALGFAIIGALATWGAVHGHGPFGQGAPDTRLALMDTFIATVGCTALLIAAVTSERQGAREAARESEGLLEAIIAHTPAVIYVKDIQGRYLMANRRYEELWNMPNQLVRGKTDYDVFPPHEAERFRAMDQRVIQAGRALTEEEVATRDDGLHTYVSVKFPLRHAAGEPYAVVGISTDITELHQAQARLREAYAELDARVRERTAELATAVSQLQQSNQEKETLLREIHHRVKNNLQVICSLLNLQAHGHEPQLVAFAENCKARVRSMALVHEHLYHSKNLQCVPLTPYLGALIQEVAHAQSVSDRVHCHIDVADIVLPVDQAIPCGLIVNELVTNACKHAFPGGRSGRVSVSLTQTTADCIDLVVADDGAGMPQSVNLPQTNGFGLELVRMLADQLAATLAIGRHCGTRVELRFRRHNP